MRILLSILLGLVAASSLAAELVPVRRDAHLGASIQGTALPESFRRDLTSGLTNRLMIRLTLHREARELQSRAVEIAIRYDLWDEQFAVITRVDGAVVNRVMIREIQQVIDTLRGLQLPELFPVSGVPHDEELIMHAIVLLNPIDRERMDAIRKWVTENSSRSPLDPAGAMGVADISVSNAIFNRIFEQYAGGSDVASAWQQTLATKPFRLDRLPHESR